MNGPPGDPGAVPDRRGTGPRIGAVVLGLLLALALVAILATLAFDAQPGERRIDVGGGADPTTTMVPTRPEPVVPVGADSPLVGLTETRVRELYPLVRIVAVDGEALPVTMDLVVGRIDLAVDGGIVVGATVEGCEGRGPVDPEWVGQSCDPDPSSDGPDVSGRLAPAGVDGDLVLDVGAGKGRYYQGMAVVAGDSTLLRTSSGAPLAAEDLVDGDLVRIWTASRCRESSPVQCDITAIVVDRPG